MSLLKLPRSVDWSILEVGLGIGRKMIVMDYVGCARTVQVTPGRRSALSIVIVCGTFGYTEGHNKSTPVASNRCRKCRWSIISHVRTSGQTEYGTTCLGRMEWLSVVMRWV